MPRRHWHLRIADMLDAAETAVRLTKDIDQETFFSDRVLVDAVIKNIVVLGEAASRVPDEVTENQPDVPWREMRDMRNFIVHEYFGLNRDVLWGTVRDDISALIPLLRRMLEMGTSDLNR
ncbi:MAG: HepT-like ribonuclease domain-containing protein [Thermoleophilia bacterium]